MGVNRQQLSVTGNLKYVCTWHTLCEKGQCSSLYNHKENPKAVMDTTQVSAFEYFCIIFCINLRASADP